MSWESNVKIFNDTQAYYLSHFEKEIGASIEASKVYATRPEGIDLSKLPTFEPNITVTKNTTIQAALKSRDAKIAILNFASATNPGGGVMIGSSAQEEAVCRCTTLYECLAKSQKNWDEFYSLHRKWNDNLASNRCIYTPNVVVFKDDSGKYLPYTKNINVITCAAPNLRHNPANKYNADASEKVLVLTPEEQYSVHLARAEQILLVAIANRNTSIVLGAFGCGAFKNDPSAVSAAYRDILKIYGKYFKNIEFAVYCGKDWTNYEVFKRIINC